MEDFSGQRQIQVNSDVRITFVVVIVTDACQSSPTVDNFNLQLIKVSAVFEDQIFYFGVKNVTDKIQDNFKVMKRSIMTIGRRLTSVVPS